MQCDQRYWDFITVVVLNVRSKFVDSDEFVKLTLATKSPRLRPLTSQSFVISSTSNRMRYDGLSMSSNGVQWNDVSIVSVAEIG